jgi:hypothetical protein
MVVVDMKSMLPKSIGREACLQARIHFGLLKNLGPKRREESKEAKDSMKVENGSVHCYR